MILKILIVCFVGFISIFLFRKASGTLNPLKINIISLTFYELFIQLFIGSSLIWIGLINHYLIDKVKLETTIDKSIYMVFYLMLSFPLVVLFINRLFRINISKIYNNYLEDETVIIKENIVFWVVLPICFVCIASIIYVFMVIGEIPCMNVFSKSTEELAKYRIVLKREFKGNIYIRNILALFLTPVVSYLLFIYAKCTHKKRWIFLFIIMFIASIIILTYDFEKIPLIRYVLGFAVITIILDNGIKLKKFIPLIIWVSVLIILMYAVLTDYDFNNFSISTGPIGRIIFTPAGAFCLHVDTFPEQVPFLQGRSFSRVILRLFGSDAEQLRSGEIVMRLYNFYGKAIKNTAGVMNAVFIGEAFANFGYIGLLLAPLYVAALFGALFIIFLKLPKDTLNIWFFSVLTLKLTEILFGGFIDYIYNPALFIFGLLFITLRIILDYKNYFRKIRSVWIND